MCKGDDSVSNNSSLTRGAQVKSKVLHAAAKLFLEKGYTDSKMREISTLAGVNYGSMMFVFHSKEDILSFYTNFLKSLSMKIDSKTIQLFFQNESLPPSP